MHLIRSNAAILLVAALPWSSSFAESIIVRDCENRVRSSMDLDGVLAQEISVSVTEGSSAEAVFLRSKDLKITPSSTNGRVARFQEIESGDWSACFEQGGSIESVRIIQSPTGGSVISAKGGAFAAGTGLLAAAGVAAFGSQGSNRNSNDGASDSVENPSAVSVETTSPAATGPSTAPATSCLNDAEIRELSQNN